MSIQSRVKKLRAEYTLELAKQDVQVQQSTKTAQQIFDKEVDNALQYIYSTLEERIANSCGVGYDVGLPLRLPTAVLSEVTRRCGLQITLALDHNYRHIHLSEQAKRCTVTNNGETTILDFLELIEQNQAREEHFQEHLQELAKKFITQCILCLESLPHRYYGIHQKTPLVRADGTTAFPSSFIFQTASIRYSSLLPAQMTALTRTINNMVAHAEVEIRVSPAKVWVCFEKRPDKDIEQAYFDYATYYQRYDAVTPELQMIIDHIVTKLQPASVERQIAQLHVRRQFTYWFKGEDSLSFGPSLEDIKYALEEGVFKKALTDAIEKQFPGITPTAIIPQDHIEQRQLPVFNEPYTYHDERLDILYEIKTLESELARTQMMTEQNIRTIIAREYTTVGTILTERLLHEIESIGVRTGLRGDGSCVFIVKDELLVVEITSGKEHFTIDLSKVLSDDFLSTVEYRVGKLTNGFLKLDLTQKQLRLEL